ncbi:TonB-dependent receptor domain-containing protein [Undibacterium sp. Di27W]|uniref:TonB-dependent receptor domain-containing protein n=1 Tax=Undibacterium sp. Di27W TaxID=3413036 RepID=UPI003BF368AA
MIFKEKKGVQSVRLALSVIAGSMLIAGVAHAQTESAAPQRIEITGSNIKRTDKEGTAAIQTISTQEIRNSGASTVLELMKALVPGMGTGGYNNTANQNGFSKSVAVADLRSLGATSTLILLNGRRMAPAPYANPNNGKSTLYDLNNIPVSALEKVEVLKDGASAIYGSDAIGGVINFITRRDYQGGEINATIGANDDNRFGKKDVNAFYGQGDLNKDGYNFFVTGDFSRRDPVWKRDGTKDIEQNLYGVLNNRLTLWDGSALANALSNTAISNQPTLYRESAPGNKNFPLANSSFQTNCADALKVTGTAANHANAAFLGKTFCVYDTDGVTQVQNRSEEANFMGRGEFKINENLSAFFEAAATRNTNYYTGASTAMNGRSPTTNFTSTGLADSFQAILPVGHPDNPYNVRTALAYRFENLKGGSEEQSDSARLLGGLKGTVGTIDWETGVLWSRSKVKTTNFGLLYLPTLRKLITDNRSIASIANDPNIARNTIDTGTSEITQWDGRASTEVGSLGGGAIGVAAGFEFRQEKIKLDPDADKAAGNILGNANTIIDGKRKVGSAFVEVRAPFAKTFEMDFAGRLDKYDGLKSNFAPKAGAKWTPNDTIALRGTYSEGFRAPALTQVTPGGAQFFLSSLQDRVRCPDGTNPAAGADPTDCAKTASGTGGANPNLKPETAKAYTLGLVLSPTRNFDVALDWYKVRKEGEVILTNAQTLLDHETAATVGIVRDPNQANWLKDAKGNPIPGTGPLLSIAEPWINQGATETSGIDLDVRYRTALAGGKLETSLSGTYILSYRRAENIGDNEANVVGGAGGTSDWNTSGGDIPRVKARLSANWTKDVHNVFGAMNYTSGISLLRRSDNQTIYPVAYCQYGTGQPSSAYSLGGVPLFNQYIADCSVAAWTTVDIGYKYTGIKNLTLGVTVANVFDAKAPYDPRNYANGYNDQLHNNTGRYFTFSANYKFK